VKHQCLAPFGMAANNFVVRLMRLRVSITPQPRPLAFYRGFVWAPRRPKAREAKVSLVPTSVGSRWCWNAACVGQLSFLKMAGKGYIHYVDGRVFYAGSPKHNAYLRRRMRFSRRRALDRLRETVRNPRASAWSRREAAKVLGRERLKRRRVGSNWRRVFAAGLRAVRSRRAKQARYAKRLSYYDRCLKFWRGK
jgi:hypothetical protein